MLSTLKKTFDNVPHQLLLLKPKHYFLVDGVFNWIEK